jgi:hypothetical protein
VPEWRDLLLAKGGADRDREVAGGVQHQETALGCDVNSLTRRGTKTPPGQCVPLKAENVNSHVDRVREGTVISVRPSEAPRFATIVT